MTNHEEVFKDELGTMTGFVHEAKLLMNEGVTPKFYRPLAVPFALKGPVEQALACMEQKGILRKVSHSE